MSENENENTPVESNEDKPKRRGGKKPFTITALSREWERAKAELAKVSKGNSKLAKAEAKLAKAQQEYDDAVSEAPDNSAEVDAAQARVDEARAKLDEALSAESGS